VNLNAQHLLAGSFIEKMATTKNTQLASHPKFYYRY